MTYLIVLLGIALIGGWFRYNLNMSAATAKISRALAGGAVEPGLQDAITPPLLALNYYVCFIAAVFAWFGLPMSANWSSLTVFLALFLGAASAPATLVPPVDSPYWARRIRGSLCKRGARYGRWGKTDRATAMLGLASRIERAFPDTLRPSDMAATK